MSVNYEQFSPALLVESRGPIRVITTNKPEAVGPGRTARRAAPTGIARHQVAMNKHLRLAADLVLGFAQAAETESFGADDVRQVAEGFLARKKS
jgi:hypothetical protein